MTRAPPHKSSVVTLILPLIVALTGMLKVFFAIFHLPNLSDAVPRYSLMSVDAGC
jgi:hypothetical protein